MVECIVCISGLPQGVTEQRMKDEIDQFGQIAELYFERTPQLVRAYVKILSNIGLKKLCACLSKMIFTEVKLSVKPVALIPLSLTRKEGDETEFTANPFDKSAAIVPQKTTTFSDETSHGESLTGQLRSVAAKAGDSLFLCVVGFPRDATEEDVITDLSPTVANITRAVLDTSGEKVKAYVEISPASELAIGHKRLCAFLTKELSSESCKFNVKIVDRIPNVRPSGLPPKSPSLYNDHGAVDYSRETPYSNNQNDRYTRNAFQRDSNNQFDYNDRNRHQGHADSNRRNESQQSSQRRPDKREASPPRVHYDPTKDDHACFELESDKPIAAPIASNVVHNIKDLFSNSDSQFTFGFSGADSGAGDNDDMESSASFAVRSNTKLKCFDLPTAAKLQKVKFFNPEPVTQIVARSKLEKNKFSRQSMKLKRLPFWARNKMDKNKANATPGAMLHEILLTMLGKPGSLFNSDDEKIVLKSDLPFFHPHEAALINQLAKLGAQYRTLQNFVMCNTTSKSLYQRAVSYGVDECLDKYRQCIFQIESDLLRNSHMTISFIKHKVGDFFMLLPDLVNICALVDRMRDIRILDVLHNQSVTGKVSTSAAVSTIQYHCHLVFYSQITAWVLHGLLLDTNDEFFIQKSAEGEEEAKPIDSESPSDVEAVSSTAEKAQPQTSDEIDFVDAEMDDRVNTDQRFAVVPELLPGYIFPGLAEKMRFVGECVRMFQHDTRNKHRYRTFFNREHEFSQQLHNLANNRVFDLRGLEKTVESIRVHVAEELWTLIVEQSNLTTAFEQLRNYYMLGDGQLITVFIALAKPVLHGSFSNMNAEHDLNNALTRAAALLNPLAEETEVEGRRVKLLMDPIEGSALPSKTGWPYLLASATFK